MHDLRSEAREARLRLAPQQEPRQPRQTEPRLHGLGIKRDDCNNGNHARTLVAERLGRMSLQSIVLDFMSQKVRADRSYTIQVQYKLHS